MIVGRFIGRLFLINALMLLILGPEADGGRKRSHEEAATETSIHSTRTTRQTAQKKTEADEAIRKAYQRLELKKWGSSLLTDYTKEALHLEDYKEALDKQHHKGIEEGLQKGREEGETKAKQQMALNLLEQGVDMQIIAQASSLSERDIQQLAQGK